VREATRAFAQKVDLSFYLLAAALRGSPYSNRDLPDLRESHRQVILTGDPSRERYALVNVETDRLTNSINTFAEQVVRLLTKRDARSA
jgi:hypothetical protein